MSGYPYPDPFWCLLFFVQDLRSWGAQIIKGKEEVEIHGSNANNSEL